MLHRAGPSRHKFLASENNVAEKALNNNKEEMVAALSWAAVVFVKEFSKDDSETETMQSADSVKVRLAASESFASHTTSSGKMHTSAELNSTI